VTVNETLDSILDESGDEEEQDAVVNQVLDEIGIEISGKVSITAIFFFFFFFKIAKFCQSEIPVCDIGTGICI